MVRHSSYARALVAGVGVLALLPAAPAPAAPVAPTTPAPTAAVEDATTTAPAGARAPLRVDIATMTPSALPARGTIRLTGTVTNRSEETWSDITVFAVVGDVVDGVPVEPMRDPGDLQEAMETPADEVVGERVTDVGTFGDVGDLEPGETAPYEVEVPVEAVTVTEPGVYWFGAHALGASASVPDDLTADGRARTFLPVVPRRFDATPVATSLVVPLTHPVRHAPDGSVDDPEGWGRVLGPDGRLTRLLDFVDASGAGRPVTWLVDPALVDAAAHLAAGNRPRSLAPTRERGEPEDAEQGGEGGETGGAQEGGAGGPATTEPTTEPTAEPGADPVEPSTADAPLPAYAQSAAGWLDRLGEVLGEGEVLTLPYGNLDVPATLAHAPELLDLALAQRSTTLGDLGLQSTPVLASPSGYLDAAAVRAAEPGTRVLVTDRMFAEDPPAVVDADGQRLLVTSYGATQGSPGPSRSLTPVGIRQRILAEAAVRVLRRDREPLVAVLPLDWRLRDAVSFFAGLEQPWVARGGLTAVEGAALASGTPPAVSADDLDYPRVQRRRQLDASTVGQVRDLVAAGDTLQNLLVDNNEVGGTITEEALPGLSYVVRNGQTAGRLVTGDILDWVDVRLGGVRITASPGVTLASRAGQFVVTLDNSLDQRVEVSIRAVSDAGIEVEAPETVVLPPGGRDTVFLEARTTTNSVHNVELLVTDATGTPLGSTDRLPIRSTEVSGVIWLILGTGMGLLFLAIVVRLVRRVRAARRGDPSAGRRSSRLPAGDQAGTSPVEVG